MPPRPPSRKSANTDVPVRNMRLEARAAASLSCAGEAAARARCFCPSGGATTFSSGRDVSTATMESATCVWALTNVGAMMPLTSALSSRPSQRSMIVPFSTTMVDGLNPSPSHSGPDIFMPS